MIQLAKSPIILYLFLMYASPGFSGALDYRTMQRNHHIGSHFIQGPIYPNQNRNPQSLRLWPKKGYKFKHKHHPYRFVYDPRVYFYGNRYTDKKESVEINILIDDNVADASKELPTKKEKTYSPPHIFNLNDSGPNQADKHLKSAKNPNGVILIHGTSVSEVKPATD
jgi:hypothetical protein